MTISLTSEQEAALQALVEAGLFTSKEAALAHGLRRLTEDAQSLADLRADIQAGIDQADRGEFSTATGEDIKADIRRRLDDERHNGR